MKKIKIGAIGCGGMGLAIIKALLAVDDRLQLVGINDPNEDSIKKTLEEIKPAPKVYDSYQNLVSDSEIDWVMIASWNNFHKEQNNILKHLQNFLSDTLHLQKLVFISKYPKMVY